MTYEATHPAMSTPIRNGTKLICEACCDQGHLYAEDDFVVYDCPIHMKIVIAGSKVVSTETRGLRQ